MYEDYDEEIENTSNSGGSGFAGGFSTAIKSGMKSDFDDKDIQTMNNLQRDRDNPNGSQNNKKNSDNDSKKKSSSNKSDNKNGLDSKKDDSNKEDSKKDDSKKDNKSDKKDDKKSKDKSKAKTTGKDFGIKSNIKKKLLKIKIILIGIGIALSALMVFGVVIMIYDSVISSITSFFGIKDSDEELYAKPDSDTDQESYLFDENGDPYTMDDLKDIAEELGECSSNNPNWDNFIDDVFHASKISSVCQIVRIAERYEKKYSVNVDIGLVIGTVYYTFEGYDTDDYTASNHYDLLDKIINKNLLSVKDVKGIVESQIMIPNNSDGSGGNANHTYYVYQPDEDGNNYSCVGYSLEGAISNPDKWKVFMRYGAEAASEYEKYYFDNIVVNYTSSQCSKKISATKHDLTKYTTYTDNESSKTTEMDYTTGYIYNNFLSINKDNNDVIEIIENKIDEIYDRKDEYNDVLGRLKTSSSGITGENCLPYLPAGFEDIEVHLTDCSGNFIENMSFKDYIIGVARSEVYYSWPDDAIISEMIAAISYSLNRHNNYQGGSTITMKSGTCDQVTCNPTKYCVKSSCSGVICSYVPSDSGSIVPLSSEQLERYESLYEQASSYLLVSGDAPYAASYTNVNQWRWFYSVSEGKTFEEIMTEEYPDAKLIKCSGSDSSGSTSDGDDNTESSVEIQYDRQTEVDTSISYPNKSPNIGKFIGFPYKIKSDGVQIEIDPKWVTANIASISSSCSSGNWNVTYRVNFATTQLFTKAFSNICTLLTDGVKINGKTCKLSVSDLSNGSVFVQVLDSGGEASIHAYGIAQDWNYDKSITVNGTVYKPYSANVTIEEYNNFVKAIGGEDSCQNINYVLWKYAYEPAGFTWGGNSGRNGKTGIFNPMRFEIKR